MASLYIKDPETAELAATLAARLGTTKTAAVRDALRERLAQVEPPKLAAQGDLSARLAAWRKANPLPPPTGLKADKAFFDELWGEP